jgi:hypothetical protein
MQRHAAPMHPRCTMRHPAGGWQSPPSTPALRPTCAWGVPGAEKLVHDTKEGITAGLLLWRSSCSSGRGRGSPAGAAAPAAARGELPLMPGAAAARSGEEEEEPGLVPPSSAPSRRDIST